MLVKSCFMENKRDVRGIDTYKDLIDLVVSSSRIKYDSFKHVVEPIHLSYTTQRSLIHTSVDFDIRVDLLNTGEDSYDINIIVDKVYGVIERENADGSRKELKRLTLTNLEQTVDSIYDAKERICDQMTYLVEDDAVSAHYWLNGTGQYIQPTLKGKFSMILNHFKTKLANFGSRAVSGIDINYRKLVKMF